MSSNSVCNHTRDAWTNRTPAPPILVSFVWLQTEVDSTQSFYYYLRLRFASNNKWNLSSFFNNRHLNTIIMSATITPRPETLRENVTLAFRNLEVTKTKCSKTNDYSGLGLVVKGFVDVVVVFNFCWCNCCYWVLFLRSFQVFV